MDKQSLNMCHTALLIKFINKAVFIEIVFFIEYDRNYGQMDAGSQRKRRKWRDEYV